MTFTAVSEPRRELKTAAMSADNLTGHVYIVDDDEGVRAALASLLESEGYSCSAFGSTEELLAQEIPPSLACLILDVRLPGTSGLDLQQGLKEAGSLLPIIFMTGYADVEMCARAMKRGASEFLTKPFEPQRVVEAVREAIELARVRLRDRLARDAVLDAARGLTPREHEVMELVVEGLLNKQIAGKLGISEVTVKLHRASVMRKMQAKSLADLVRMGVRLDGH